mgnify:FL=1
MSTKNRIGFLAISLSLFFFAFVLFFIGRSSFYAQCASFPAGSLLGPIDLTGKTADQAADALSSLNEIPLDLVYQDQHIQVLPTELGIQIAQDGIRESLHQQLTSYCGTDQLFSSFFSRTNNHPVKLELSCNISEDQIRTYLENEISPRYDHAAMPKLPDPGASFFVAGSDGQKLDLDAAVAAISTSACNFENRTVTLPVEIDPEPPANIENLEIILKHIIDQNQDSGQVTEIYLIDPQTESTFDIARINNADIAPEIAFTAASTIKVPVMISSFRRMEGEPNAGTRRQLEMMITESKNDQTDWLMQNIVGGDRAPEIVTGDLEELGLTNTFLAGYFYFGAPLLNLVKTDANSRTDINLKPDIYNQTTAKEMAQLMNGIYRCDKFNDGILIDRFNGEVSQDECAFMLNLLRNNHLPYLISAGVPEEVPVAHKHGWIEEADGLLHTMSNVAVVNSPNGDYILSIFTYHPTNLIFEKGNVLFSRISDMVYKYFNPVSP